MIVGLLIVNYLMLCFILAVVTDFRLESRTHVLLLVIVPVHIAVVMLLVLIAGRRVWDWLRIKL